MPVISKRSEPELYDYVKDRNLQGQWFLLETLVEHALRSSAYAFTPDSLFALHQAAANFLDDCPGRIRMRPVYIQGSNHEPPHESDVQKHLDDFFKEINQIFHSSSPTEIAAFSLWRLTWIHPFHECNGRTARAFSYLMLCKKHGRWLPGKKTIHEIIRVHEKQYYKGLQEADAALINGGAADVSILQEFFKSILYLQLESSSL